MHEVIRQLADAFNWDEHQLNRWLLGWTVVENVAAERPQEMADAVALCGGDHRLVSLDDKTARLVTELIAQNQGIDAAEVIRSAVGLYAGMAAQTIGSNSPRDPDRIYRLLNEANG
jgi:hypothetical protein